MEKLTEDFIEEHLLGEHSTEVDLETNLENDIEEEDDEEEVTGSYSEDQESIRNFEKQIQQMQYWRPPLKGSRHQWMPSVLDKEDLD